MSARFCFTFRPKGFSKGEIDALGAAVRGCCPFCGKYSDTADGPAACGIAFLLLTCQPSRWRNGA